MVGWNRLRTGIGCLAALLVALPTSSAEAQTARLSLFEAMEQARANNPGYQVQRNQLHSSDWAVRSAYGSLFPTSNISNQFGYTASGERRFDSVQLGEQPAIYSSRYNLGMSLSLNGTSLLAPSVARAQARATAQTVDGVGYTLQADVTQRYLSLMQARDAVDQAERELARTQAHLELAQARLEVGSGTQLDVRRSEVQRGQAEVRLVQARNTASNEVLLLGQIMGTRLPQEVELTDRFTLFEPVWEADQLVSLALGESPNLRASRAQLDAAQVRARQAQSGYLPTLSFSAGLSGSVFQPSTTDPLIQQELARAQGSFNSCIQNNELRTRVGMAPTPCTDPTLPAVEAGIRERIIAQNRGFPFDFTSQPASASFTVSLPLFTGLNRQQQVEEARVARLNAQHQVRAQELQVEVDVETSLRNLQTAHRTALLQRQVRETAEEELRLAEERFRFGAATTVEVVDAQASVSEAERAEIAAVYDFHRTLAVLEARLGRSLSR